MSESAQRLADTIESHEGIKYIDVVFMRHGPRNTDGFLASHTEERTRGVMNKVIADVKNRFWRGVDRTASSTGKSDVLIKTVGSPIKASKTLEGEKITEQRAMKTAEFGADEIQDELDATMLQVAAEDETGPRTVKPRSQLSFEAVRSKPPYEHRRVYDTAMGRAMVASGFMTETEFTEAAKSAKTIEKACGKVMSDLIAQGRADEFDRISYIGEEAAIEASYESNEPAAQQWREESAGGFAQLLLRYRTIATKVNTGMTVRRSGTSGHLAQKLDGKEGRSVPPGTNELMLVAGTHGGTMEYLLSEALVCKTEDGGEVTGFNDIKKVIGGSYDTSEAYTVRVAVDPATPREQKYQVILHSAIAGVERPQAPSGMSFFLDPDRVAALSNQFTTLHKTFDRLDALNRDGDKAGFELVRSTAGVAYDWKDEEVAK